MPPIALQGHTYGPTQLITYLISRHYLGSIIGKKGATKIRIERDTKTDIKIPKHGQEGDIVIFGPTASVNTFLKID